VNKARNQYETYTKPNWLLPEDPVLYRKEKQEDGGEAFLRNVGLQGVISHKIGLSMDIAVRT
jgi:hypothetical protein